MTAPPAFESFNQWLLNKQPADYWYYPNSPDDFGLRMQARLRQHLARGQLRCQHVTWHITNRCNLLCAHCGVRGGETSYQELSLDEFAKALQSLLRLGVSQITLSGGEPLVRKDLPKILAVLKICGLTVGLVSNGHHLARYAQNWEYAPDSLSLSLDGLEQTHNALRLHPDSYRLVLESLEVAHQLGPKIVNINTCVTPQNLAELPKIRQEIFERGADHWILRPVTRSGRASDHPEWGLDEAQLFELLEFARTSLLAGYDLSLGGLGYLGAYDSLLYTSPWYAGAGWDSFYILPNGDIKGLNEDYLPVEGNLRQDKLEELWYNAFKRYRQLNQPEICQGCEFWARCAGGNHAEAQSGLRCIRPVLRRLTG